MHDLLGAHRRLSRLYRLYLRSAFPLRDERLRRTRDDLVKEDRSLAVEPLIEPMPEYMLSDVAPENLGTMLGDAYEPLNTLAPSLMGGAKRLYQHQWQSVVYAVQEESDLVVTTGTGSGKTECFLLPLLAHLSTQLWREGGRYRQDAAWWEDEKADEWAAQRANPSPRTKAVRAFVLYPLNALVEDQLVRLRRALLTEEVVAMLEQQHGGDRITFGRYTGDTPIPGPVRSGSAAKRLAKTLRDQKKEWGRTRGLDESVRHFQPDPYGPEMWSRWDMQTEPPDILITNYPMLNIMLNRSIDNPIFEQTRSWLEENDSNFVTLVVDELHSYRGTPGTEVGYVLRLLAHRLGLRPDSRQLRILATSASLEAGEKSDAFLEGFFGRPASRFNVISDPSHVSHSSANIPVSPFVNFACDLRNARVSEGEPAPAWGQSNQAVENAVSQLTEALGATGNDALALGVALQVLEPRASLRQACAAEEEGIARVRATRVSTVAARLFPGHSEQTACDALEGFLLAGMLAIRPTRPGDRKEPSIRVRGHLFFRNLRNIWACSDPKCSGGGETLGALFDESRYSCNQCGGRTLDLIVCTSCGEAFLGGYRPASPDPWHLTPDAPDIERAPEVGMLQRTVQNYAVYWPETEEAPDSRRYTFTRGGIQVVAQWLPAVLVPRTGELKRARYEADRTGWLFDTSENEAVHCLPPRCPRCGCDHSRMDVEGASPLRNHRTGLRKVTQVLAEGLFQEMMGNAPNFDRRERKLVLFTDSRQDAARLATRIESDHLQDMVRLSMEEAANRVSDCLPIVVRSLIDDGGELDRDLLSRIESINKPLALRLSAMSVPNRRQRKDAMAFLDENLYDAGYAWADGTASRERRRLWEWTLRAWPEITLGDLVAGTVQRLVDEGMCPGGTVQAARTFTMPSPDGSDELEEPWSECFHWSSTDGLGPEQTKWKADKEGSTESHSSHRTVLRKLAERLVMEELFPHQARTYEGLNRGRLTYDGSRTDPPDFRRGAEALIWICGVKHRYPSARKPEFFSPETDFPKAILDYIRAIGVSDTADLISKLRERGILTEQRWRVRGRESTRPAIQPSRLSLTPPIGTRAYQCPRCAKRFLENYVFCPSCGSTQRGLSLLLGRADGGKLVEVERRDRSSEEDDYYLALSQDGGKIFRLNAEELTGQTDKKDRAKRQRWFQEAFLPELEDSAGEKPAPLGIDLLSVTTTMEAGVDIGPLSAVVMANVPPKRFNYQQRVGRAGRRANPLAIALTYCRGRSHDEYYFRHPESITGDRVPSAYVDVARESILRRVIAKEALRDAYQNQDIQRALRDGRIRRAYVAAMIRMINKANDKRERINSTRIEPITLEIPELERTLIQLGESLPTKEDAPEAGTADGVHGEFGLAEDWNPRIRQLLSDRLQDVSQSSGFREVIEAMALGTAWDGGRDPGQLQGLTNRLVCYVQEELIDKVDEASTMLHSSAALGERLANLGVLPMFGFPTRVRYFSTRKGGPGWPPTRGVVDRNLDLAITSFAPGSTVMKDKMVHTSVGVAGFGPSGYEEGFFPPFAEPNPDKIGMCMDCRTVVFADADRHASCPSCGGSFDVYDTREPRGFVSSLHAQDDDGWDGHAGSSTQPLVAFGDSPDFKQVLGLQASLRASDAEEQTERGEVRTFNAGPTGDGFTFVEAQRPLPGRTATPAKGVYVVPKVLAELEEAGWRSATGGEKAISLLSKKVTDVLLLGMRFPKGNFADPTTVEGRAAWSSFGFMLRGAVVRELDVETSELEVGLRTTGAGHFGGDGWVSESGLRGEVFLSDALENGAGYASHLFESSTLTRALQSLSISGEFVEQWLDHAARCDSSCGRCLRDYANGPHHGILDWRLAIDMARLARGELHSPSLAPWSSLLVPGSGSVALSLRDLGYQLSNSERLPVFRKDGLSPVVIVHPLWTTDHEDVQAVAQAIGTIRPFSIFRAVRRPMDANDERLVREL